MKKWTDTQYDYTDSYDGQRFDKLKLATWNVREMVEKSGGNTNGTSEKEC